MGESHTQFEPEIYEKSLTDFTTKELVEELQKRNGVKSFNLVNNGCVMAIGQLYKARGPGKILAVKL
ncbi:MAG: BC1881 family protein [Alphaproteobacteria bacterium]|nr:BC1881 family protein [Alphaproteobacteria bacterium]